MPYRSKEDRREADRRYRQRKADKAGKTLCEKAGAQRKIPRCAACPESGGPCRDCYNAHRRTYRKKEAGYIKKYTPSKYVSRPRSVTQKKNKPFKHKADVVIKPVDKFLIDDIFGCPGCLRKLRGAYRYCPRCEEKRNVCI